MNTLPKDLLQVILSPFQNNEQSFLLSLVNKQFNSIVKVDKRVPLDKILHYYAECGYISCLNWFKENGVTLPDRICSYAANGGHLDTIKWAISIGCKLQSDTSASATYGGHLQLLKWIKENNYPSDDDYALQCASRKGHKDILLYFMSLRSLSDQQQEMIVTSAAEGGQLGLFKWLIDSGFKHNKGLYFMAAHCGRLDIIKWARQRGIEWDPTYLPSDPARRGHLDVLQWLLANGCNWNPYVVSDAASNGHLEVMKWAFANGAPISVSTCINAAKNGHFIALKWAIENDFPLPDDLLQCAASSGNIEMVKWLCELSKFEKSAEVIRDAASKGHLEVVKWLRENGFPWTGETRAYARRQGHQEVVKWCSENGCPEPTEEEDFDYEEWDDCDCGYDEYVASEVVE